MPTPPAEAPSGAAIRAHRLRAGLSTAEYARLLGIGRGSVENWEHERTRPRPKHVLRLNELLAQPPERLAQLTPPPTPPAPTPVETRLRTCGDLVVLRGDQIWVLEIKSTSCTDAAAFQRQVSAALRRDGLRVYRELPGDGDDDELPGILLSS